MAPDTVLWAYRPHTEAEHRVLHGYLQARLPIMGQSAGYPELVMIDGFAGPGRYEGNKKGSPLLMLDAFLEHNARERVLLTPDCVTSSLRETSGALPTSSADCFRT